MGNCQAVDSATLVIQHPSGRVDKLYRPVTAGDIIKSNPGHYVALLLTTTTFCPPNTTASVSDAATAAKSTVERRNNNNTVRVTRIKLLRPTDTLILGQVYRLITNQEVMKGLSAKKYAKMKKNQELSSSDSGPAPKNSDMEKNKQVLKVEKHQPKPASSGAPAKSRPWQPSLNSISESTG